jgi:hypothetical protein
MNPIITTTTGTGSPCMKPSENSIGTGFFYPIESDYVEEGCSVAQINGKQVDDRYFDT